MPEHLHYGAQTARSLYHFNIGSDKMPPSLIRNYGLLKMLAAEVNLELGLLPESKARWIIEAAGEIYRGELHEHFPLSIWQTGSGTQTNMNLNEVIARRAKLLSGEVLGTPIDIHPNDDVNKSQSSNDTFPTVMHMSAVGEVKNRLLPMLHKLRTCLQEKVAAFDSIVKIGRTHLMDALPMTLGQEFSGYLAQIEENIKRVEGSLPALLELAIGGTAIGTGFLAPRAFAPQFITKLRKESHIEFVEARNKFAAIAAHDALVAASAVLKTLACSLMKIATDLAFMGSGPRCGLGELFFPENEPGSSIMPGKSNPTQCEALLMIATQVIGNDTAISIAGSRGNFELNVFKPLIIHNFLHSVTLLSDGLRSFVDYFLTGLKANEVQVKHLVERSLMLATALRPLIGYDKSAEIAMKAYHENLTLKQAALKLGYLTEQEFDQAVDPLKMLSF